MQVLAEQLAVLRFGQYIGVGVDAGLVQLVQAHQFVAHFIGRIAEHQNNLLAATGNAAQANGEAIAAQDGENDANGLATQLVADVFSNGIHGCIVTLGTGHDGLGNGHDIAVAQLEIIGFGSGQNAVHNDLGQIVTFTDDGAADTAGDSANISHKYDLVSPTPG